MMDKHRSAMKPPVAYFVILSVVKVVRKLEMTKIILFFLHEL